MSLALLVNAGQLKTNPLFIWLPFDLTLALTLTTAVAALIALSRSGLRTPTIAAPMLLILCMVLALFSASFNEYSSEKALTFFTVTLVLILSPFMLLQTERQQLAFFSVLVAIALFVALFVLILPSSVADYSERVTFEGTNTIGTSRIAGTGALICITWMLSRGKSAKRRVAYGLLAIPLVLLMVQSGTKGPFVSLAVAVIAVVLASRLVRRYRFRAMFVLALATVAIGAWLLTQSGDGARRILGFLTGDQDSSTLARQFLWEETLRQITANPFGLGFGDFHETDIFSGTLFVYPHNLFLEVLIEAGWVAGGLALLFVVMAVGRSVVNNMTSEASVILGLAVFTVANAMVSGDINANRLMWVVLSMAWIIPRFSAGRPLAPVDPGDRVKLPDPTPAPDEIPS